MLFIILVFCVVFVPCLVCPVLPVSGLSILDCPFGFLLHLHSAKKETHKEILGILIHVS